MFNSIYKSKKIIITGNTGFKGSWLTSWLLELGADIYGISNDVPTEPSMFNELDLISKIKYYNQDIRDLKSIKKIINEIKPDFLFHLAAQPLVSKSYDDPVETISTNVQGTANILDSLRLSNHRCTAIIITSDKCYDNVEWPWGYKETDTLGGKDIYSGSKGAAELVIKSFYHSFFKSEKSNIRIASARAGNVIGGGDWATDRIIPDCINAWQQRDAAILRNPNATRPWQHVLEPLSGYLTLGEKLYENNRFNGETFNFGPPSDQTHTVLDLVKEIINYWPGEKWIDKSSSNSNMHEAQLLKLNCDKAFLNLNWQSILDFKTTSCWTGEWYKTYYDQGPKAVIELTREQIQNYMKYKKLD